MTFSKISQTTSEANDIVGRVVDENIDIVRGSNKTIKTDRETSGQSKFNLLFDEAIQ